MQSFLAVTGPKTDIWLVKTVSLFILSTSLVLFAAWLRRQVNIFVAILAISNAIGLIAIDIYYVSIGIIRSVYLLDAIVEVAILTSWLAILPKLSRTFATDVS